MQYSCLGWLISSQLYLVGGKLCSIKTSTIIVHADIHYLCEAKLSQIYSKKLKK